MPKVTENYKKEKAEKIVKATIKVLKIKPLYNITMLDIIKTAGLSKGGIYLYFNDIDDLLVEAINMIGKEQDDIEFSSVLDDESIESSLVSIFEILGDYIDSCPAIIGKIRFELIIYISNNPEKADTIMSKLKLKNIGRQFMENVAILIQKGIEKNVFRKELTIDIVMNNISAYIDGITDLVVNSRAYGGAPLKHPTRDYFQQFVESQILLLKNK
ncbi:transcriptional regulator, TetR family [Anaerocolumna jejuensis DSM 15929]|uniref:Transcriptional regulator, TetR family n=1 Tax=Anaerocolumna jejuensis DSM 15929 TaxID=1121322 RepID=A0A1M6LWX8_9FIRM|nr:TetR/AcrR family transcriptional regulator [Anaerocolumna jejuensis]SHJ75764.1 transcriptional regulator, TetR family [Anaerocolumna jejuensis DSM 15929]